MELLAPAKDLETLTCAYDAGADAVYVGLKKFSARARAKNLTIEELYKAVEIKKKINKKLYIALNTLIFEEEIPELIEILIHLKSADVDGIIIQDYGIYQLRKDFGIEIPLHASTQMGTKNYIQAKFLEDLGFRRVILERQLSLDEIKSIRKHTTIELEVFIHGAMCFSLSGYCFFSRMLGKRSGNRGDCAQPCRWSFLDYEKRKPQRPFFMKDLSAITLLPELKRIGINSIKIEGRLKGIEYVYNVVSLYRKALENLDNIRDSKDLEQLDRELQNIAFARKSSTGFYTSNFLEKNLIESEQDSVGLYAGTISQVYERSIYFKTKVPIKIGDGLRILNSDDNSFKLPVKAIYKNNKKIRNAEAGDFIGIPCNIKGVSKNSKVYLTHHRFSYKSKIRIPDKVNIPDVRDTLKSILEEYHKRYSNSIESPAKINLKFEKDKIYNLNGRKFVFLTPDIYESEIKRYEKIANDKDIDGVFISHPVESKLFKDKTVYGSFYLYVTNKPATKFMNELRILAYSKAIDLDDKNFKKIKNYSKTWIFWQNVPLWITRVQKKEGVFRTLNNKKLLIQRKFGFLPK